MVNSYKIDLHVHTQYSPDSNLSLEKLIKCALKRGLNALAITDHNTIAGALKLRDMDPPFQIIVGEEVKTDEGELIGYFLEKEIPPGLSSEDTVKEIRSQKGIVSIPHPFDTYRKSRINPKAINRIIDDIDAIEVFNSRNIDSSSNRMAQDLATRYGLLKLAGSDAHTSFEIGNSFVEFEGDPFLINPINLSNGQAKGCKSPIWVHFITKALKLSHEYFGK